MMGPDEIRVLHAIAAVDHVTRAHDPAAGIIDREPASKASAIRWMIRFVTEVHADAFHDWVRSAGAESVFDAAKDADPSAIAAFFRSAASWRRSDGGGAPPAPPWAAAHADTDDSPR